MTSFVCFDSEIKAAIYSDVLEIKNKGFEAQTNFNFMD